MFGLDPIVRNACADVILTDHLRESRSWSRNRVTDFVSSKFSLHVDRFRTAECLSDRTRFLREVTVVDNHHERRDECVQTRWSITVTCPMRSTCGQRHRPPAARWMEYGYYIHYGLKDIGEKAASREGVAVLRSRSDGSSWHSRCYHFRGRHQTNKSESVRQLIAV